MIISTDSFLKIGKTHKSCEDYVINDQNLIIVSDGCSSSKNTDIGSRLISLIAKDEILSYIFYNNSNNFEEYVEILEENIIEKIKKLKSIFSLDNTSFDATLLIGFIKNDKINILVYGDGNIIEIDKENNLRITNIEFTNNAPYYLSYYLNGKRYFQYFDVFPNNKKIIKTIIKNDIKEEIIDQEDLVLYSIDIKDLKYLILSTDGISSFVNQDKNEKIDIVDIVKEITSFKNNNGVFLQRRMNRMLKEYEKNKIFHYDDIGIGCFHFNHDE